LLSLGASALAPIIFGILSVLLKREKRDEVGFLDKRPLVNQLHYFMIAFVGLELGPAFVLGM